MPPWLHALGTTIFKVAWRRASCLCYGKHHECITACHGCLFSVTVPQFDKTSMVCFLKNLPLRLRIQYIPRSARVGSKPESPGSGPSQRRGAMRLLQEAREASCAFTAFTCPGILIRALPWPPGPFRLQCYAMLSQGPTLPWCDPSPTEECPTAAGQN